MLVIKINRDTPLKGGSGYTQILQSRKQEVIHHLVLSCLRLNELRMSVNVLDQLVGVFAEFKEVCLFLRRLALSATVRTLAVDQLGAGKERLTRCTIHTLILTFINITFFI